ncbi:RNA polymerase factor sigma-54 [bacterium]|nr:RNA polymerase factor sigma-54 [candidate division CSSED10-310 bacterium]
MIGMEQRLQLKLAMKLVMTPNLQLAIKLLQLNKMELIEAVNAELQENPTFDLEAVSSDPVTAITESREIVRTGSDTVSTDGMTAHEKTTMGEMDWDSYFDNGADYGTFFSEKKEPFAYENIIHRSPTLAEHLMWQLSLTKVSKELQDVAVKLIGNLNDDGYLSISIEEMAERCRVAIPDVEQALQIIQEFDPVGVGARNLEECLLIQVRQAEFDHHRLAETIIREHLARVERNSFKEIAKILDVDIQEVLDALDFIRTLEPKPGRSFSSSVTQYIQPDVYIYKIDDEYRIVLNEQGLPKLRINKLYQHFRDSKADQETRQYVEQKFRNALWLIKSVEQRQRTIYRVAESILKFQRAFFERGIHELRPLVLRDVADDIGMHESTVSRVSTNKYMHTPQGIFEIKYFFHSGLSSLHGEDISSIRVKEIIKNYILNENPASPLSDRQIMDLIQKQGITIARRTIAKYREELNIPPSNRRRSI